MRQTGTVVRGIRTPIIQTHDNLAQIVVESLLKAQKEEGFLFEDKDIVAVTEAVVGISQNNYATLDQIAYDVASKFKSKHIGLVFPILSRNRFSMLLKAFAKAMDKITILLSYPKDEVGNSILYESDLKRLNINPYDTVLTESFYETEFSHFKHPFTGINMVKYYKDLVLSQNCQVEFVFSNNPSDILKYTKEVLVCDIHQRFETKEQLLKQDHETIIGLDDLLTKPVFGSGFNETYGLYGSNMATKDKVKLFPKKDDPIVYQIQRLLKEKTNKLVEVMIYGDGAFKDPVGHIWELADPVVSPSYTKGLEGSPNELKLKYITDDKYSQLKGDALYDAVRYEILNKSSEVTDQLKLGTTPRRYVDLIGSLCDLVSGSGDKGTPVVYIKNYFKNYAEE